MRFPSKRITVKEQEVKSPSSSAQFELKTINRSYDIEAHVFSFCKSGIDQKGKSNEQDSVGGWVG